MSNLHDKSNAELRTLREESEATLRSIIEVLATRQDMQEVIHRMMSPDDALEAFSEIGVKDPDLARVTLQAAVAALVNSQSVLAVNAELKRRVKLN